MTARRGFLTCLWTGLLLAALTPVVFGQSIEAITRPSEDVTLSFVRPGRIGQVLVKEGDKVSSGQVLVKQDDSAELFQLKQLKSEADSDVRIRAAEAQLAQKQVEYEKMQDAGRKGAVPEWDVDQARVAVKIADLSLELARFEREQARLKYEESKRQVERMQLTTPIDGKVEVLFVKPGESSDSLEEVIRVVKVDPLWVDVPVRLLAAKTLACGGTAVVRFGADADEQTQGRIIHIAAVADAASNTITCRVEVPNRAARPAGEHVQVSFTKAAD